MVKTDIHLEPDKVQFSLFTTDEIKKMCVMQIITPLMLDPLGHPIPGGLYDKRLGDSYIINSKLCYCLFYLYFQVLFQTRQIYVKPALKR